MAERPAESNDVNDYRMTIGEHLEELRTRILLGVVGFVIAAAVCLAFGEHVVAAFLRPLMHAMEKSRLNPMVVTAGISDEFMVYIRISLICAAAIASPWMLYQLWLFVAAGLYPQERKTITKYLPLSIALLFTGMAFLYFVVLPLMLEFFLMFSVGGAVDFAPSKKDLSASTQPAVVIPSLAGDPPSPLENQVWFDAIQKRLKIFHEGEVRIIPFMRPQLSAPQILLPQYIDMVVDMLLAFGLAFQMPLVVLALVKVGILNPQRVKKIRGPVYFVITVLSAMIVPDVVTGMVALMFPLFGLFEFGLWLAKWSGKKEASVGKSE